MTTWKPETKVEPKKSRCPMPRRSVRSYAGDKHIPHFHSHFPDVFKIQRHKEKYSKEEEE